MAQAPRYKVYRNGEYVAACKYAEDAAAIVAMGTGEVRDGHKSRDTVWREGHEEFSAGESYDRAAAIIHDRCR